MQPPLRASQDSIERRLVALCIPGDTPPQTLDPDLAQAAIAHGLGPLLGARVSAGEVPMSGDFARSDEARELERLYRLCARVNAGLGLSLELLLRSLGDSQVPAMVLKGDALLRSVYRDPGRRPMGDIDLLVQPRDWSQALAAAAAAGARTIDSPKRRVTLRFFHEIHCLLPGGGMLDLHRGLAPWPLFSVEPQDLFERGEQQADGAWLPAPEDLFVSLALHAAKDGFLLPLRSLVDGLALLATGRVDPAAVEARARRWNARRATARWLQLLSFVGRPGEPWDQLPERLAPRIGALPKAYLQPPPSDPSSLGARLRIRRRQARALDQGWRALAYGFSGALLLVGDLVQGAYSRSASHPT